MTEATNLLSNNRAVIDGGNNPKITPHIQDKHNLPPIPPDHHLLAERHYEAGPPEGTSHMELVRAGEGGTLTSGGDEDTEGDTFATTKEEEWVTKKKTEVTTTRQIETRVKRQVVLEDGKVVEDTGPIVTTNTTEDTEKQEHEQTERRKLGASEDAAPDEVDGMIKGVSVNDKQLTSNGDEWRVISVKEPPHLDGATVVKEVKEHRVLSREETEETRETEDVQHLGDITDEQYLSAVRSGNEDIRKALAENKNTLTVSTGPRIVHQSTKTHKTVDTEDKHERSAVQPDGRIITETKRTTEHDETKDEELTDENASDIDVVNESSQRHHKTKDQEHIDYIADGVPIGREMRYTAETAEGERYGDPGMDEPDWDSLSTRIRKSRRQQTSASRHQLFKQRGLDAPNSPVGSPLDRKDALTKRPLDFDQEEETRKEETSKWLEHHFGSESRSSKDSLDEIEPHTGPTTSYFNVTIKSKPTVTKQIHPPPPVTPKSYITSTSSKAYTPTPEPINDAKYYQGVTDWSERRYEDHQQQRNHHTVKDRHDVYRTKNHYGSADELERDSPKYFNGDSKHVNGHESPYTRSGNYSEDIPERDIHFKPIVDEHRAYKTKEREDLRRYPPDEVLVPPTVPQRKRMIERKQRSSDDSYYDSGYRSHSRNEMSYLSRDSKDESPLEEPPPDYSPPPRVTPSSSPSPPLHGVKDKKLYQRTRFAADIPPPTSSSSTSPQLKSKSPSGGNFIGQGIRKLVGKIRSASAERKAKQKAKRHMSRSPSPHQNSPTYQQFNVIDNNIPPPVGLVESSSHQRSSRHNEVGGAINDKQVSTTLYQKQKSNLSSNNNRQQNQISDQNMAESRKHVRNVPSRGNTASPVQRYYLGEDPFGGSIYGRENKYDGVKPARSTRKYNSNYHNNVSVKQNENGFYRRESPSEDEISRIHSSTLGRLSKSTSRLAPNDDVIDYSRNVQTLPRNIHHYNNTSSYKNNTLSHSPPTRLSKSNNNTSSTINVSIINTVSPPGSIISTNRPLLNGGPAKPARTYKSTLSRSKSFNVHGGMPENQRHNQTNEGPSSMLNLQRNNLSSVYKSNPHLHRLDENPMKLKSPGIVSSISRSQRDINEAIIEEDRKENTYTPNRFSRNGNGENNDKKKIFMKGLADTAPELFKTLHANEDDHRNYYTSTSGTPKRTTVEHYRTLSPKVTDNYRNNFINTSSSTTLRNTNDGYISPISKVESNYPGKHTTLRRGSSGSDNYSETYHITSKSDDPNHPSVTDTVKSFTKKTVPSKDGKSLETIESTETKTITKSRYRGNEPGLKYIENGNKLNTSSSPNGGVVIEVRNNKYRK